MRDLIPAHGGHEAPLDRTVPPQERKEFLARAEAMPKVRVSDGDLATLYRFGDGGLTPLTGPMVKEEFDRVLDEEVIVRGGKKYAWAIPLSLPVDDAELAHAKPGSSVALTNPRGEIVGTLEVKDVFPFDKARYNAVVYQTERTDHPGARIVLSDPRAKLMGGEVRVLPATPNAVYGKFMKTPVELRAFIREKAWKRCVAFQTRNPLHRAHEYALVAGLERLTRDGHFAGAILNPLVGETKSDDVDAETRMRTYQVLIEGGAFGEGDTDEALWAAKPYKFRDVVALVGLDIKMFYAGPKEAIMHAICRQNYGFTDIIIGRKHADAPYDDGKDIWDGLAAQRKFDELKGELLIKPVKIGFAAFFQELGRVGLVEEYQPKGYHPVSISGRELRQQLGKGELPDPRIMRRETAQILIEKMKGK
jgi:sulfate adenylyltransferase